MGSGACGDGMGSVSWIAALRASDVMPSALFFRVKQQGRLLTLHRASATTPCNSLSVSNPVPLSAPSVTHFAIPMTTSSSMNVHFLPIIEATDRSANQTQIQTRSRFRASRRRCRDAEGGRWI